MSAIDNTNLINVFGGQNDVAGFIPAAGYTYDAATGDVVVTDGSTIPAGDTLARIKVQLFDKFGGEVRGTISALAGTATLSAATLNTSEPLDLKMTIVTAANRIADGGAYNLLAAGDIRHWDIQKNAKA
jgi:hypothetical protein